MRTIERSSQFKKDYKRIKASPRQRKNLDDLLSSVLLKLISDEALPVKNHDHELSGDWANYRECHIQPDLLLIYRKTDFDTLRLARLGSHSELFG